LDRDTIVEVLNASSGRNVSTETTFVAEILTGRYEANFSLGLFSKDLGIAAELAKSLHVDSPVCDAVSSRLAEAAAELGPESDYTQSYALWARSAGLKSVSR
jgi:3-hydroxyisobutyrate dehydrogenase